MNGLVAAVGWQLACNGLATLDDRLLFAFIENPLVSPSSVIVIRTSLWLFV